MFPDSVYPLRAFVIRLASSAPGGVAWGAAHPERGQRDSGHDIRPEATLTKGNRPCSMAHWRPLLDSRGHSGSSNSRMTHPAF